MLDVQAGPQARVEITCRSKFHVVVPADLTGMKRLEAISAAFEVAETEPVLRGQTAAASYKPAVLDNGVRLMVPPFISIGDRILVSTIDGTYAKRAEG